MPTITGMHFETQDISGTGKTWIVDDEAEIHGENYAIFEDSASIGNTLRVFGVLSMETASGAVIGTAGDNVRVAIASAATLSASFGNGVAASGDNARITNAGTIDTDDGIGISIDNVSGAGTITNNGAVIARIGIHVMAAGVSITNAGTIRASEKGVEMVGLGAGHELTNQGRIAAASGFAVLGSDYDDTVVNSGEMSGRIFLNDGNDLFDHRRGRLSAAVEGGEGDDTLITRKSSVRLTEQADDGFDTVKSTVSYTLGDNVEKLMLLGSNELDGTGSAGDDLLYGNRARNVLQGLAGEDSWPAAGASTR